jgi:hypothetical protein
LPEVIAWRVKRASGSTEARDRGSLILIVRSLVDRNRLGLFTSTVPPVHLRLMWELPT